MTIKGAFPVRWAAKDGDSPIMVDVSPPSLTIPLDSDGLIIDDAAEYPFEFTAVKGNDNTLTCTITAVSLEGSTEGLSYGRSGNKLIIVTAALEPLTSAMATVTITVKKGSTTLMSDIKKSVQIVGTTAGQTVTGPPGKSVSSMTPYYALSNSSTTAPTLGWGTEKLLPTSSQQYVWSRFLVIYDDGSSKNTEPYVCIQFTNGIDSYEVKYGVSSSISTPPSAWASYDLAIIFFGATLNYLWEKVTITYTDGRNPYVTTRVILTYVKDGESPIAIELSSSTVLFTKYGVNVITYLTVYKGTANISDSCTAADWREGVPSGQEHILHSIAKDTTNHRFILTSSLISGKYFDGEIVGTITVYYDSKTYYKDIHFQCNMRKSAWSIMDWEEVRKETSHTFYSDDNVISDLFISDIVIYDHNQYRCKKGFTAGSGTGMIPWGSCVPGTDSEHWEIFNYTKNISTGLILADKALIKNLLVNELLVTNDNGTVYGGFLNGNYKSTQVGNYRLWLGAENPANAPFSVDKDGNETAKNLSVTNIYRKFDRYVLSESETSESLSNYLTTNIKDNDPTALTAVAYQNSNRSGGYAIKRRIVLPYAGNVIGKEFDIYSPNTINDSNGNTAAFIVTVQNAQGSLPDFREMDGSFLTIVNGFANSVGFNLKRFASANDITCKLKVVSVMYDGYPRWLILDNKNVFISTSADQTDSVT